MAYLPEAERARWTTTHTYDTGCTCNLVRRDQPLLNAAGTAVVATHTLRFVRVSGPTGRAT